MKPLVIASQNGGGALTDQPSAILALPSEPQCTQQPPKDPTFLDQVLGREAGCLLSLFVAAPAPFSAHALCVDSRGPVGLGGVDGTCTDRLRLRAQLARSVACYPALYTCCRQANCFVARQAVGEFVKFPNHLSQVAGKAPNQDRSCPSGKLSLD